MGMDVDTGGGKKRGNKPEMNVTPLVDVVLVLLIIFMVIAPTITKGLFIRLPPKPEDAETQAMAQALENQTITLYVREDGEIWINRQFKFGVEQRKELPDKLERVLNSRPDRVVYVDAQDEVEFRAVIDGITLARGAKAAPIVMLTEPVKMKSEG
jgi:biopolymer transport protein ExbD